MKRLALALFLMVCASGAQAETCTVDTTATMSNITTVSVGSSATWGCTPSADDNFVVTGSLTITGAWTQDGITASTGLRVASGGTLTVDVSTAAIVLSLNDLGLDIDSGGTANLRGMYRNYGLTTLSSSLTSANQFTVGTLKPCDPGGGSINCATDPSVMRFEYDAATYNESNGVSGLDTNIETGIGAITTNDVLCFYDPDTTDKQGYGEAGYCYAISAAGDSVDAYGIEINVRQGTADSSGYPLARRDIQASTVGTTFVAGTRNIAVGAAAIISADRIHTGKCIFFESGTTGFPESVGYKISDTEDDAGGDTITLASMEGAGSGHTAGDDYYIMPCWKTGDPFFIGVPVTVQSATASTTDSPLICDGTCTFRMVRALGMISFGSNAGTLSFTDYWQVDANEANSIANCGEITFCMRNLPAATAALTWSRISLTGGTATAANDKWHGMSFESGSAPALIDGFSIRYHGDDAVVFQTTVPSTKVSIRNLRASLRNDNMASGQLFDPNSLDPSAEITNFTCDDCTDDDNLVGPQSTSGTASVTLSNGTVIAQDGITSGTSDDRVYYNNLTVIGSESATNTGRFIPARVNRFSIREVITTSTSASALLASDYKDIKNGFVRDATFAMTNSAAIIVPNNVGLTGTQESRLENVAMVNLRNTGTCATSACKLISLQNFSASQYARSLKRFTFAWTPGTASAWLGGLEPSSGDQTGMVISGGLITGVTSGAAVAYLANSPVLDGSADSINLNETGPICFWNNVDDYNAHFSSNYATRHPGSVVDKGHFFVNPGEGRFDVVKGSPWDLAGCGAKANAGVTDNWSLSAAALPGPETLGNPTGGGGGTTPRAFP